MDPSIAPDPYARLRKGDHPHPDPLGERCPEYSPRGYRCTRAPHPPEWQHIANGFAIIAATWGGVSDD